MVSTQVQRAKMFVSSFLICCQSNAKSPPAQVSGSERKPLPGLFSLEDFHTSILLGSARGLFAGEMRSVLFFGEESSCH